MSEEQNIPDEELPDNDSQLPEQKSEDLNADTLIEAIRPSALNPQPSTSAMEVHHHGHVHEKKKWKEYVFQFFMLFLAVFCGFLAEYQLEHTIEHNREKQFMASLLNDLELDSIQFNSVQQSHASILSQADSVLAFFAQIENQEIPAIIYQKAFELIRGRSFYQNSGTIDQLKNSGGMRLISKRVVVDSIQGYDLVVRRLAVRDQLLVAETIKKIDLLQKLFEGKSLSKIFVDTMIFKRPVDLKNTIIPVNNAYISEYLNHLRQFRFHIYENMVFRDRIALRAANLISLIKKEYHLK